MAQTGIGKQLKHLRRAKSYTQMELADRLQLSKSAISAYEQDRKVPSLDTVIQLATYFDVSVDYLLVQCVCQLRGNVVYQLVVRQWA